MSPFSKSRFFLKLCLSVGYMSARQFSYMFVWCEHSVFCVYVYVLTHAYFVCIFSSWFVLLFINACVLLGVGFPIYKRIFAPFVYVCAFVYTGLYVDLRLFVCRFCVCILASWCMPISFVLASWCVLVFVYA